MKKLVKLLKWILPYFAMFEGIDHFIFSTIAVIGLSAHHQFGFFEWFTPIMDYILGMGTFLVGWIFKPKGEKKNGK